MKCLARLFTTRTRASDGSLIPRHVVEEYLNSDTYRESIESGTTIGGLTHAFRVLPKELKGVVGSDDQLILEKSGIWRLTRIFLPDDPQDEWVYGELELFDESQMDTKSAENIKYIKGLIRQGIKMTISACVVSYWSETEEAQKIINIKSVDATLSPAFKGARILKILEDEKGGPE